MEQTLKEYLRTHPCQGFNPVPHYSALGDFLTYYFRDDRAYEQRVDEVLTVYLSMKTHELVGFKITGINPFTFRADRPLGQSDRSTRET